jgi:ATP-dependent helicase HrpB
VVRRLWDARDRLRPHREPEIHRIDLSGAALDVIAWGGDPRTLEWFDRPREDAIDAALTLLARLGLVTIRNPQSAIHNTAQLTEIGEQVRRLPLHPRLARMLVEGGGSRQMARACALLSERHWLPPRAASTASDLLSAIDGWSAVPTHVQRTAGVIADFGLRIADSSADSRAGSNMDSHDSEETFCRAVFAGYPDRVAQRRQPGSPNVLLSSGTGATMAPESGVRDAEFLVALDISGNPQFATVRLASRVAREWLAPTVSELVHRYDKSSGRVRAALVDRYDALVLAERPAAVDPEIAARLLADAWLERGPGADDIQLLRRLRFAGQAADIEGMVRASAYGVRSLDEVRVERALTPDTLRSLERDAPISLVVPSGRHTALEYQEDGSVSASVKLQELFGLAETPRVGRQREPVVLALLAPNGRPVQVTRDLRSFWDRTYPEVRKELRGRYPKHPWPEDPWTAPPTARTKRRQG